jgi:hypothetical protein
MQEAGRTMDKAVSYDGFDTEYAGMRQDGHRFQTRKKRR